MSVINSATQQQADVINPTGTQGIASATAKAGSAADQRIDFMQLLIAELQNQNPLEPLDNQQMASQLAQFTQLELTEEMTGSMAAMNSTMSKMNTSFEGAMIVAQLDYAKSLLGKTVEYYYGEYGRTLDGQVNRIFYNEAGHLTLEVDSQVTHPDGSDSSQTFYVRLDAVEGIKQ